MKKILFIGGYNSRGMKANTLESRGYNVLRLLPDYDKGLSPWIKQAEKIRNENKIDEIHASSTGAQVACKFPGKKVLYSPVINPFRQPRISIFSKRFLKEAWIIETAYQCKVIIPEEDEVLDNDITLEFCKMNGIKPIVSKGDDHGLTKFFNTM